MADRNRVRGDANFFNQQPHDLLAVGHLERVPSRPEPRSKVGQSVTQTQVARLIDGDSFERLPFCRDRLLLGAECRHPGAQLVQRHQLLLIRGDQPLNRLRHPRLLTRELVQTLAGGIALAGGLAPSRQLGFDEGGILKQAQYFAPHERIEVVFTNRWRGAHRAVRMLIAVTPQQRYTPRRR